MPRFAGQQSMHRSRLYELRINGKRVGDHVLAPEWTDYTKRIQYQTYDVTSLLKQGDNAIGAYLAAGLVFRTRWPDARPKNLRPVAGISDAYGCRIRRRPQTIDRHGRVLEKVQESPIVSSDVYDGETYDARKEQPDGTQRVLTTALGCQ